MAHPRSGLAAAGSAGGDTSGLASQIRGVRLTTGVLSAAQVWLFDLDDTLHDAASASMPGIHVAMGEYMQRELRLSADEAQALRRRYWLRYGATLLGLVRHHGVKAAHFLHDTHRLPGLEARVSGHRHDFAAIRRLPGRKLILTNAPRAYALRVLGALRIEHLFDAVISHRGHGGCSAICGPSPIRACCVRCARGCACTRAAACWWRTRWRIRRRRGAVGMRTVWMRRYAARRAAVGSERALPCGRPTSTIRSCTCAA